MLKELDWLCLRHVLLFTYLHSLTAPLPTYCFSGILKINPALPTSSRAQANSSSAAPLHRWHPWVNPQPVHFSICIHLHICTGVLHCNCIPQSFTANLLTGLHTSRLPAWSCFVPVHLPRVPSPSPSIARACRFKHQRTNQPTKSTHPPS